MSLSTKMKQWAAHFKYPLVRYQAKSLQKPQKLLEVKSAWGGLELIIEDILIQHKIPRNSCIEFGVEFGFSSVVFSNYFQEVTGVDLFIGDEHTEHKGDHFEQTKSRLKAFENIKLFKADYRDWIAKDQKQYDFAHVDIVHTYQDTFDCGLWAATHAKCTVFHDTESFPEVRRAVFDIAKVLNKKAFNYPKHHGLGIIV